MQILIINKKFLINTIFFISLAILSITIFCLNYNKFKTTETLYPVDTSSNNDYDFTGDGIKDSLEIVNGQNKIDFNIKSSNADFYLSNETADKILFTTNNHLKPNVFIHNLSRDNIPEIILLGPKNNKMFNYIFQWNKDKFSLLYEDTNNMFGILDCKNTKTPQCYSLSSSVGISSLNSFMIINNTILDTTSENQTLPTVESVLTFINLIELQYELDELPDIFTSALSKEELSLFWNLDKDNYSYAFQNAFFYDYEWNDASNPSCIKWRLSFEKNKLNGSEADKSELVLLVDLIKDNSSYKITSIQKSK